MVLSNNRKSTSVNCEIDDDRFPKSTGYQEVIFCGFVSDEDELLLLWMLQLTRLDELQKRILMFVHVFEYFLDLWLPML
jgi:hypothetical protein